MHQRNTSRFRRRLLTGLGLGLMLFAASAVGLVKSRPSRELSTSATGRVINANDAAALVGPSGASLDATIADLQTRLELAPADSLSWATLGLAYVQQAKATVNPEFYPRADGALAKSLAINDSDNFLAYAGLSALASARHDFDGAKQFATQGLAINSYSAILYGALSDAELQLGHYDAASQAAQKMLDLSPDTSSLSRASYIWELRGDTVRATTLMQRALDDAPTPADRAFAQVYLGELAFNQGDPNAALDYYNQARNQSPTDPAALAGKARAEAALGQTETAITHFAELVERAPDASYILEYGELLQSVGRIAEAQQQYEVFLAAQQLFEANGVQPDATLTMFHANHGDPQSALRVGEAGIASRPFIDMYDAYAWALHVNGRDSEALAAISTALNLGAKNALFHFHAGMIQHALGNDSEARNELSLALEINPFFNPLDAPLARQMLNDLTSNEVTVTP
jgi:tetratricopeptide (TPR) repeat protein